MNVTPDQNVIAEDDPSVSFADSSPCAGEPWGAGRPPCAKGAVVLKDDWGIAFGKLPDGYIHRHRKNYASLHCLQSE